MTCSECGREHNPDAHFCSGCGTKLALGCPTCGRAVQPGDRFCDGCGHSLGEPGSRPAARDPRAYTPKHLAEKILTSRAALEGERKQVYEGHAVAHGKSIPLLPVMELLRNVYGVTEHDRPQTAREKVAGRLLLLDEEFRESLPLVFDFLGVPDPTQPL